MTKYKSMPTSMVMNLNKMNDDDSYDIDPQLKIALKHALRYIQGTVGYDLRYVSNVDLILQGYADTD
jgi:hypothetical protein